MAHMKVYRVVCSIYENGKIVDISLAKLLDRLSIRPTTTRWSDDYDLEFLIKYLINGKYKVRYRNAEKFVMLYEDYQLPPFYAINEMGLGNTASYMNSTQDRLINRLTQTESDRVFYKYGNDYTKQTKGERYL